MVRTKKSKPPPIKKITPEPVPPACPDVFTERTRRIRHLDDFIKRATLFLQHNEIDVGDSTYNELQKQLNPETYIPAVVGWLQAFNLPQMGIQPGASGEPEPKYKDRLPLFGCIFILETATRVRDRLAEIGEENIHIEEATALMEDYMRIGIAHVTINPEGVERNAVRKGLAKYNAGLDRGRSLGPEKRKRKALHNEEIINREVSSLLSRHWTAEQITKHLYPRQEQIGLNKIYTPQSLLSKIKKAATALRKAKISRD